MSNGLTTAEEARLAERDTSDVDDAIAHLAGLQADYDSLDKQHHALWLASEALAPAGGAPGDYRTHADAALHVVSVELAAVLAKQRRLEAAIWRVEKRIEELSAEDERGETGDDRAAAYAWGHR